MVLLERQLEEIVKHFKKWLWEAKGKVSTNHSLVKDVKFNTVKKKKAENAVRHKDSVRERFKHQPSETSLNRTFYKNKLSTKIFTNPELIISLFPCI